MALDYSQGLQQKHTWIGYATSETLSLLLYMDDAFKSIDHILVDCNTKFYPSVNKLIWCMYWFLRIRYNVVGGVVGNE